jgi:hypothetical protein
MAKRNPKPKVPVDLDYALTIEDWDLDYSFTAAGPKGRDNDAYIESGHLHVHGTLSHPRPSAGRIMKLAFVPANNLLGPIAHLYKTLPELVGSATWSRNAKAFEAVLSIPATALAVIVPQLVGGHFKHVMLRRVGPFRGRLDIGGFEFIHTLTADHFPEGAW